MEPDHAPGQPREALGTWRRYFDERADAAGGHFSANGYFSRRTFEVTRDAVVGLVGGAGGESVLDVGCGNGQLLHPIVASHRVHGVDLSEKMCALAMAAGYRSARVSEVEKLDFEDGSFDVAVCSGVLQLLPSAERSVAELVRVTKPGGRIVVSTLNQESWLRAVMAEEGFVRTYRAADLFELFAAHHLADVELAPLFYPFAWTFNTRRPSFLTRIAMASFVIKGVKGEGGARNA